MGRFAMAWASSVCELHQQFNSPITLTISSWDPLSSRFSPPIHHRLPLPVDAELLVASVIHNFLSGESQIHVVSRKGSALMIGCFDADLLKFEVLVEVDLPEDEQQNGLNWAAEVCWLVDGPLFVAQVAGKLMIVHNSICERSQCLETSLDAVQYNDMCWRAYLLNLEGIGDIKGVRTLYCGELGAFEGSDLLLGLEFSSGVDFQAVPSCRFRAGWNFVRISADQFSCENSKIFGSSDIVWKPVPLENGLRVCNDLFPSDVCLDFLSCIGVIPRDPVTAVSCSAISAYEDNYLEASTHDIVMGYWNGKIAKYRMGTIVAQIDLEDAPVSLQFAIVAEGQGIVLCILSGEGSTVVALCAETLLLLKAWPDSQDFVIGDFQMIGHDQLLLLSMSFEAPKTGSHDNYLIPQQLTDLKCCYFSTSQEPALPDLSGEQVEASELHKTESLNAIAQCLKSRMEAGLLQMRSIEEQRVEKAELVKSSCGLLQEMALIGECHVLGELSGKFAPSDLVGRMVKASIRQNGTCGRSWFLVVNIENMCQKDIILQDLSLSLTTIRGPISGSSSVVKSLCTVDKEKHLVTAVPLMDLPDASVCPLLHLLLNAKVCKGNTSWKHPTSHAPEISEDRGGPCYMNKAWIGQIEMKSIFMKANLDPAAVPLDFREVVPKHTFMINGIPKDKHMEVVNAVKAALKMEYRVNRQLQSDTVHELVASQSALWADTTIISTRETHMVTLRAEDAKHLSVLKTCLTMMLQDKLGLQMEAPYPEIINSALSFLKTFKEEIEYKKALLKGNKLKETGDIKAAALLECDMQMSTDRQFSSFFARVMKTDCV